LLLTRAALALLVLAPLTAAAQRLTTRDALVRMEDILSTRQEEGVGLPLKELAPALVVSVQPAFEETKKWYPTAALASLVKVFGAAGLRNCEACMAPRVHAQQGRLEENSAEPTIPELVALDDAERGKAAPAKAAIWLDETQGGVSLRIIDLRNSRIVYAENFDPQLSEPARTYRELSMAKEIERRHRGDALTHTFIDFAVFPSQHVSFDWTEQWGETNLNLSGLTFSLFDPVVGIGAAYYRIIPQALNIMVGAQVLVSIPTALVNAIAMNNMKVIDSLFTGVLVARIPFGASNFGAVAMFSVSNNIRFGLGISLLNISLLPFLP
jgi:hypothetical protein